MELQEFFLEFASHCFRVKQLVTEERPQVLTAQGQGQGYKKDCRKEGPLEVLTKKTKGKLSLSWCLESALDKLRENEAGPSSRGAR